MDLYVYETPNGHIADFRPYLDGYDHSFDDHRPLAASDPRQEKVRALRDPIREGSIAGTIRFVGRAQVDWRELMKFPITWPHEFAPEDWSAAPAG